MNHDEFLLNLGPNRGNKKIFGLKLKRKVVRIELLGKRGESRKEEIPPERGRNYSEHILRLNCPWNLLKCRTSLSADPLAHAHFRDAETRALLI